MTETVREDLWFEAAMEAHVHGPDHRRTFRDCPYEPCRQRRAALARSESPSPEGLTEAVRERLVRDFASSFIRIRGAHNPKPGEPCPWCQLAAEQATEALLTNESLAARLRSLPADSETP